MMNATLKLIRRCLMVAALLATGCAGAVYPDKPIRIIVPYSAGGGTDIIARVVANHLGQHLKIPVVVENRDGATGMIGSNYVANAPPDGYTLEYTVADTHSINPHLFPEIPYNALKDFVPIAIVGSNPNVLIASAQSGIRTMADLISRAKAAPGKLTFASWGIGSGGHVRMAAFMSATGIDMLHVPYKSSGAALIAVVSGRVDIMILPAGMAKPQADKGNIQMLAVDTSQRYEMIPDVKTYAEQGLHINLVFWHGLLAPKGVSAQIVNTLNEAMTRSLATQKAQADLARIGVTSFTPGNGKPEDVRRYFDGEFERWGEIIKNANIRLE